MVVIFLFHKSSAVKGGLVNDDTVDGEFSTRGGQYSQLDNPCGWTQVNRYDDLLKSFVFPKYFSVYNPCLSGVLLGNKYKRTCQATVVVLYLKPGCVRVELQGIPSWPPGKSVN